MVFYSPVLNELRSLGAELQTPGRVLVARLPKSTMSPSDLVRCGLLIERASMFGYVDVQVHEGDEFIEVKAESD